MFSELCLNSDHPLTPILTSNFGIADADCNFRLRCIQSSVANFKSPSTYLTESNVKKQTVCGQLIHGPCQSSGLRVNS